MFGIFDHIFLSLMMDLNEWRNISYKYIHVVYWAKNNRFMHFIDLGRAKEFSASSSMIWYNLANELSLSWVISEDVVCVIVLRPFLCCGLVLLVRVDHTALMIFSRE